MSALLLLIITVVVLFTVIRFAPRQGGGVPLVRKRVPPLLRTSLAVAGVAAIVAVIGITLKDLNTRLAEPSALALTLERPVRSLAERYPVTDGETVSIEQSQLMAQILEISPDQRVLAVHTQRVAWCGNPLTITWKQERGVGQSVTCDVTFDKLGVKERNGAVVLDPQGNWTLQTRRRRGKGRSSNGLRNATPGNPTYLKLGRAHSGHLRSGRLLSLLGSSATTREDSRFALLLEPLPTPDEALETLDAQAWIASITSGDQSSADDALEAVTDRNSRSHRSSATRHTPALLLLFRHSGPALLLLMGAAILIAFAIKPYSMSVVFALLAVVAMLPPLADQFALKRAASILRNADAPLEQRGAAAKLLSTSFFWGQTARTALTGAIAPESPPALILAARKELLELELSQATRDDMHRHVPEDGDFDHDIRQWTHTYLVRDAHGENIAIIVSPSEHNFGFGFNNLPAAMVATEEASGLLFANWRNLLNADPIFEQLGSQADFEQLAKVRPNESFNPSRKPLWKTLVTPRIREYVEAQQ